MINILIIQLPTLHQRLGTMFPHRIGSPVDPPCRISREIDLCTLGNGDGFRGRFGLLGMVSTEGGVDHWEMCVDGGEEGVDVVFRAESKLESIVGLLTYQLRLAVLRRG